MNGECAQNTRSQRTTTISLQTSISRKMCISTIFALANGNRAAFWQTIFVAKEEAPLPLNR